jgi:hypothetical protein
MVRDLLSAVARRGRKVAMRIAAVNMMLGCGGRFFDEMEGRAAVKPICDELVDSEGL